MRIEKYSTNDTVIPYRLDISAVEMLKNHYAELFSILESRVDAVRSGEVELDEKKIVFEEVKMILKELDTLNKSLDEKEGKDEEDSENEKVAEEYYDKFKKLLFGNFKVKKEASKAIGDENDLVLCVLEGYADKALKVMKKYHAEIIFVINKIRSGGEIIFKTDKPILYISVNDNLNVNNILPCDHLNEIYPFNKIQFYQKYWKPIFEAIGHFYVEDLDALILSKKNEMPDYSKGASNTTRLRGWSVEEKEFMPVSLSFRGDDPIWLFEECKECTASTVSKYTEQDYISNPIVRCTDPALKSIYGRTGKVVQVIPREDIVEVDVDFGRGLDVQRVSEKQIEVVVN